MTLPNFLIVGAMRSGTTSLTQFLRQQSDVFMAEKKELHFFESAFERGLPCYASHFDGAGERQVIGEATPNYMYFHEAMVRIGEVLPKVKMVSILRNPVDRAYSHYWHNRAAGREKLEFAEAISREQDRLKSSDLRTRGYYSYVDRGHYLTQLEQIVEQFDRSQLLVLLFDDLLSNPAEVYSSLCDFLGIRQMVVTQESSSNRSVVARSNFVRKVIARAPSGWRPGLTKLNTQGAGSYVPMDSLVRQQLTERFGAGNAELSRWLGRDLTAWSH